MIGVSRDNLERSEVLVAEGEETRSDIRTSFGYWPERDDVTDRITVRGGGSGVGWLAGGGGWGGAPVASLPAWPARLPAGLLPVSQSPACSGRCRCLRYQAVLPHPAPHLTTPAHRPARPLPQERIHRLIGVPQGFGEGLYVLNYRNGQKYEAHSDQCMDGYAGKEVADAACLDFLKRAGGPQCGPGKGGPTCGDRVATFILCERARPLLCSC